jgi:hypothetical protein
MSEPASSKNFVLPIERGNIVGNSVICIVRIKQIDALETELASALARLAKAEALVGKFNQSSAKSSNGRTAYIFSICADELSDALKE